MLQRPGSSWGSGALLKDTSVVVLKEERALVIHSPTNNPCRTRDSNPQSLDYESDALTIRPRLPNATKTIRKGHHIQIYSLVLFLFSTLKPFSLRNCKQIVQIIKEMASNNELSMKSWSRNTDILGTPIICFISDRNDKTIISAKRHFHVFYYFFHIKSLEAF